MEKLSKNHPRFCAKYLRHVGTASKIKMGCTSVLDLNGKYYITDYRSKVEVGEVIWVAKRLPVPDEVWEVHAIAAPEYYSAYARYAELTSKEQRSREYAPMAATWFGSDRRILTEVSKEYIQRNFGVKS